MYIRCRVSLQRNIFDFSSRDRVSPRNCRVKRTDDEFSGIIFFTELKNSSRAQNEKYFCEVGRSRCLNTIEVSIVIHRLYLSFRIENSHFVSHFFEGRLCSQKYFLFCARDEFSSSVKNKMPENPASVRFTRQFLGETRSLLEK